MSDTQKIFKITSKGKIITTDAQIEELNDKKNRSVNNEKLWTWFVAKIMEYPKYNNRVFDYLFNKSIDNINSFNIGFEVQPLSPRKGESGNTEGNTHLDLAFGHLELRADTNSGIQFQKKEHKNSKVCFIEGKFLSDLSTGVTHDKSRNQLTRVIENLLCFQDDNNKFPDDICFTLLTPRAFQLEPKAKLYGYKYLEYLDALGRGGELIKFEINKLHIPKRYETKWVYPILDERLKKLRLNWATYEDIFEMVLESVTSLDLLEKPEPTLNTLKNNIL